MTPISQTAPAALLCLALSTSPLSAHQDGTSDKLNDHVFLKELTALTDQDDGGGESEYCLRMKSDHGPKHGLMTTERLICYDVDWDDPSGEEGNKEWHELKSPRLPLVGTAKSIDPSIILAQHFHECAPSEAWTLSLTLFEVDYSPAGEILGDIADLIEDEGKTIASIFGISDPRVLAATGLAGKFARLAGKWIDRALNGADRLGTYEVIFNDGEGDPNGTVNADENGKGFHFRALFAKSVTKVGSCRPQRTVYFIDGTRRVVDESGNACLRNGTSLLCLNPGGASRRQFEQLQSIGTRIATVMPEDGTEATKEGAAEVQSALIGLVGEIAQDAVGAQLDRIAGDPKADELLMEVQASLIDADSAYGEAMERGNVELLVTAVQIYAKVHEPLASYNYGEAYQAAWLAGLTAGMERGRMLAARALQDGDKEGAMGHIGEILHAYGTLDEQLREELSPLMRELTGVAMEEIGELPIDKASAVVMEQLN